MNVSAITPSLIQVVLLALALVLAIVQFGVSLNGILVHHWWWNIGALVHAIVLALYLSCFLYLRKRPLPFTRTAADMVALTVFGVWGILDCLFFASVSAGTTFFVLAALFSEFAYVFFVEKSDDKWPMSLHELSERRIDRGFWL